MKGLFFFRPLFLWATAFAAVAVLIHFFNRQRTKKFDFSSIRFLRQTAVRASRRKHIRRLLLLLTRIIIVAVLAILFARPYNRLNPFGVLRNPQGNTFVWIDPTPSMKCLDDGAALWEHARNMVSVLDSNLPESHKIYIYDNCLGEYVVTKQAFSRKCSPVRHGPTNMPEALRAFVQRRESASNVSALILMSDFQRHDMGTLDSFFRNNSISYPVMCINLSPQNAYNYSITSSAPPTDRIPFAKLQVTARGRKMRETKIEVMSQDLRIGYSTANCEKGDSADIVIETGARGRIRTGKLRLNAEDPYSLDNVDYFVAQDSDTIKVLVVCPDNSAFPIEAVIRSLGERSRYKPTIVTPHELTFEMIDSARVVVLNSVEKTPRALQALFTPSSIGRKIILFSPNMKLWECEFNRKIYNQLSRIQVFEKKHSKSPLFVRLPDTVSIMWRGFPRRTDKSVAVWDYFFPVPGQPLLRLSNRKPVISYIIDTSGHIWLICATALGIDESNNIAETGFYVPLLDRLINFGMSNIRSHKRKWIAGRFEHNPFYSSKNAAQVYDSNGNLIAQWANRRMVAFDKPGLYKIVAPGQKPSWVAVSHSPAESRIVYNMPGVPEGKKQFVKILDRKKFEQFIRSIQGDSSLNMFWAILVLFLVFEVILWGWKRAAKQSR